MVGSGLISIRNQSASLNISKGGSTHLYVDMHSDAASDDNDGYDWSRPYKTIQGALVDAPAWTEIWIRYGIYEENLIVPHENIKLHGCIQDGIDRVVVQPVEGVPLLIDSGYCEVDGMAFVSNNASAIRCNYPSHYLHDLYIEVSNDLDVSCSGIWLNDSDYTRIAGCHLDGKGGSSVLGIRVDNGSVDNLIAGNYFTGWGSDGSPGYAIGLNDAQRCAIMPRILDGIAIPNRFISNYVGVYCYPRPSYLGHGIQHNLFASNVSYDVYDPNLPDTSGIVIRENCYAYVGWMVDRNHDGRADTIVSAYNNYDFCPLASPWSWSTAPVARLNNL
jgi:hypothetical protein